MKKLSAICLAATMILVIGSVANADYLLNIPDYAETFSDSSLSRGYWFQAPVNFVITGLRVPDEAQSGIQNVEVLKLNDIPPLFSNTTNDFTSLARYVGQPSGQFIKVNIPVAAGDYIGIFGTCGTDTMYNSYSSTNQYTSNILGNDVMLARFGMQYNLYNQPAMDVWQEDYTISRVEMQYIPEPATMSLLSLGALSLLRRKK
jgi:hypothetical protein